jgi:hypothetical protein
MVGKLEAQKLKALDAHRLALVLGSDVVGGLQLARTLLHIIVIIVLHGI